VVSAALTTLCGVLVNIPGSASTHYLIHALLSSIFFAVGFQLFQISFS